MTRVWLVFLLLTAMPALGGRAQGPRCREDFDQQLAALEREFVPLPEAAPA